MVLIYGVIPRLLLSTLCLWRWKTGRNALQLDQRQPHDWEKSKVHATLREK